MVMWRAARGISLALLVALTSCADFRADGEDAKKTEADIKSELGVDSQVGFTTFSSTRGGNRLSVVAHLKSPPGGDITAVKAKVSAIVARDFRAHVDGVTVTF
jgi:hypothetical protein